MWLSVSHQERHRREKKEFDAYQGRGELVRLYGKISIFPMCVLLCFHPLFSTLFVNSLYKSAKEPPLNPSIHCAGSVMVVLCIMTSCKQDYIVILK